MKSPDDASDKQLDDADFAILDGIRAMFEQIDPMPADLRAGFQIFYSANSAKRPVTQNFWMACAICHLEGQTDAVTWRFLQGPRDTPSNAGGPINTGFLLRQALKSTVMEYDQVGNRTKVVSPRGVDTTDDPDDFDKAAQAWHDLARREEVRFLLGYARGDRALLRAIAAPLGRYRSRLGARGAGYFPTHAHRDDCDRRPRG